LRQGLWLRRTRIKWPPLVSVALVLIALVGIHVASWRMVRHTLDDGAPAQLGRLVALERSLEALEASLTGEGDATIAAASRAVAARVASVVESRSTDPASVPVDVLADVEAVLASLEGSPRGLEGAPGQRADTVAAVVAAQAAVRVEVLAAQAAAGTWSRELERDVAWFVRLTTGFWIVVAAATGALAVSAILQRKRAVRRLLVAERARLKSEHLAEHDPLTGVANRRRFDRHLDLALRSAFDGPAFALHLVDVDELKAVNDRWGHSAGDAVLAAVARALAENVRADDLVARIGGDEFVIVQAGATPERAAVLMRRVRAAVRAPVAVSEGTTVTPDVSVGSAIYGADGNAAASLRATADVRLYTAKERKRRREANHGPLAAIRPTETRPPTPVPVSERPEPAPDRDLR